MYYLRQFLDVLLMPLRALLYSPMRLLAGAQRVPFLSLAARVALLVALLLILGVLASLLVYFFSEDRAGWKFLVDPMNVAILCVLLVAIPFVVYKALALWLEGAVSPFPDIDEAWRAGMAELGAMRLNVREVPLFMVLGSAQESVETGLFSAARLNFSLRGSPPGPAALHWFANSDGIYVCCTRVGCVSRLAQISQEFEHSDHAEVAPAEGGAPLTGTMISGVTGTSMPALTGTGIPQRAVPEPAASEDNGGLRTFGTMILSATMTFTRAFKKPTGRRGVIMLSDHEKVEQRERLRYLCSLIKSARIPVCPMNGALCLVPFRIFQERTLAAEQMAHALQEDMGTLLHNFKLRCPATVLVTGMDEEKGFQELVRRVGAPRTVDQRFGKGFKVWAIPSAEQLDGVSAHACGAFEMWIYDLFKRPAAVNESGNMDLYSLLCKVRSTVRPQLERILKAGFQSRSDGWKNSLLFSGCYFAATGGSPDKQAFVRSVLDKLPSEQADLEWTEDARLENQRIQTWSRLVFFLDALLGLGLLSLWIYRFKG